jgi:hypothetical protein
MRSTSDAAMPRELFRPSGECSRFDHAWPRCARRDRLTRDWFEQHFLNAPKATTNRRRSRLLTGDGARTTRNGHRSQFGIARGFASPTASAWPSTPGGRRDFPFSNTCSILARCRVTLRSRRRCIDAGWSAPPACQLLACISPRAHLRRLWCGPAGHGARACCWGGAGIVTAGAATSATEWAARTWNSSSSTTRH